MGKHWTSMQAKPRLVLEPRGQWMELAHLFKSQLKFISSLR